MGDWILVDSGLRPAAEHMAWDKALLAARAAGSVPNVFRFLRFRPAALVGYHQSVSQELNEDHCRAQGIEIQRRVTGGGAIYFDPLQLGWELVFRRGDLPGGDMVSLSRFLCETAAEGLRKLGVDARFRPRNDIEVGGKKLSGTGGVMDGEAVLFQGTVLIDFDMETMLRVLRIPVEKLDAHAVASAAERVTSLKALLGVAPSLAEVQEALLAAFAQALGRSIAPGGLPDRFPEMVDEALAEVASEDWIRMVERPATEMPLHSAVLRASGGTLRADVLVDRFRNQVKQVHFSGDFFVQPKRLVPDLEASLRNRYLDDLDRVVDDFFSGREADTFGLLPSDFARVVRQAAEGAP